MSAVPLSFDAAMADPCLLTMLQCTQLHDRFRALRVCRRWHAAVKQSAVWDCARLDLTRNGGPNLPGRLPWLDAVLRRAKITALALSSRPSLLSGFARLRVLSLETSSELRVAPSSPQMLASLRTLRLQELSVHSDPETQDRLFDAIFASQPSAAVAAQREQQLPLLHAWSETLQSLRVSSLGFPQAGKAATLLQSLASARWQALTLIELGWYAVIVDAASDPTAATRLGPARSPDLSSAAIADALERVMLWREWGRLGIGLLQAHCHLDPSGRSAPRIELQSLNLLSNRDLPSVELTGFSLAEAATLTQLNCRWKGHHASPTPLAFFRAIRSEQLPRINTLALQLGRNDAVSEEKLAAIIGVMQGMHALTDLTLYPFAKAAAAAAATAVPSGWQSEIHHLPSLRRLHLQRPDSHRGVELSDALSISIARCSRLETLGLAGGSQAINALLSGLAAAYSCQPSPQRPPLQQLHLSIQWSDMQLDIDALRTLNDALPSLTRLKFEVGIEAVGSTEPAAAAAAELHGLHPWWRAVTVLSNLRSLQLVDQSLGAFPSGAFDCWVQPPCFPHLSHLALSLETGHSDRTSLVPLLRLPSLTHLTLDCFFARHREAEMRAAVADLAQQQPNRASIQLRLSSNLSHFIRLDPKDSWNGDL